MNRDYQVGVRESMGQLPIFLQPFITLFTGKPLTGEKPLISMRPFLSFLLSSTALVALIVWNVNLIEDSSIWGYVLLPFSWIFCTGQLRKIQVVYAHHCVHRTYFHRNATYNDFMLEFLTVLAFVQNGKDYRRDHLGHHNRENFTTRADSDANFLYFLGFLPGLDRAVLWRRLFRVIFSPKLHLTFIKFRLVSNVIGRRGYWRFASVCWLLVILALPFTTHNGWSFVVVLWLPMFIFYNVSALLQFITEHAWMLSEEAPKNDSGYADRCWGRFLGDPIPPSSSLLSWMLWTTRLLLIHAPVRYGCLVGDLPAHDWHHLCTLKNKDPTTWPTAIFSRQEMIDGGCNLKMENRELWGMYHMLNHVFTLLSLVQDPVSEVIPEVIPEVIAGCEHDLAISEIS